MITPAAVGAAQSARAAVRSGRASNAALRAWAVLGLLAYLLLPWYALQDANGLLAIPRVFSADAAANGLLQALSQGRPWLLLGLVGLLAGLGASFMRPGRGQGAVLLGGGLLGALGLVASGFLIGAKGWSAEWLNQSLGTLGSNQFGIGWGGAVALAALVVQLAFGLARRGAFRGDLFVSAAVLCCATLMALFIAFPVLKALSSGLLDEQGRFALSVLWDRVAGERNFGLACLAGGVRCGVAWNTLFLGLLTASSTTLLGTLMALTAERGGTRHARSLNALALLPIITPPFVVGLGLILLFGRAGIVNQALEAVFGITPTRWFYGWFGVWMAQTFAFTPIAFMIMRGVVRAVAPSLEEAAQTLRADRQRTFMTVTLPLLKPGLANAFLVGFIESMADFGNPIVV
ncbi:MAG TPA: ABC transporter permease subunit, partial [Ramlibacter sp.]|nr:ABC transporter permease subunit [Ramlibacter sp.]